jgi:hypothetical protein
MAEPSGAGPASHRILRIQGGRLVNAEPRADLESALDDASAEGFGVVTTFAVDDNVYLVLSKPRGPGSS